MSIVRHDATGVGQKQCEQCGGLFDVPEEPRGPERRFCSHSCANKASYARRKASGVIRQGASGVGRKRRPLPDAAKDAGWKLRKDIERIERIYADDRIGLYEKEVGAHLRAHLSHAAKVCQDLLSRIDHPQGE